MKRRKGRSPAPSGLRLRRSPAPRPAAQRRAQRAKPSAETRRRPSGLRRLLAGDTLACPFPQRPRSSGGRCIAVSLRYCRLRFRTRHGCARVRVRRKSPREFVVSNYCFIISVDRRRRGRRRRCRRPLLLLLAPPSSSPSASTVACVPAVVILVVDIPRRCTLFVAAVFSQDGGSGRGDGLSARGCCAFAIAAQPACSRPLRGDPVQGCGQGTMRMWPYVFGQMFSR